MTEVGVLTWILVCGSWKREEGGASDPSAQNVFRCNQMDAMHQENNDANKILSIIVRTWLNVKS